MLKKLLQKHFGFNSFLKGQEDVIHKVVEGQSASAIFPTGAGKSLCYQLPAMVLPGMTVRPPEMPGRTGSAVRESSGQMISGCPEIHCTT